MKRYLTTSVLVLAALLWPAAPLAVPAEGTVTVLAGGCATHAEYDNLVWGLSADQVENRLETNGWYIGAGDDFFRRGYPTCWDDTRKVVIWYDIQLGVSDHWDIRDR